MLPQVLSPNFKKPKLSGLIYLGWHEDQKMDAGELVAFMLYSKYRRIAIQLSSTTQFKYMPANTDIQM